TLRRVYSARVAAPRPRTEALSGNAAEPLQLKLIVIAGPDFGAQLALERGTYRVGKDPHGDFVIRDPAGAHLHRLAEVLPSGIRLADPGSTNGSFCEGMRFQAIEAKPGATVRIGRTVLKIVPAAEAAPTLKPSASERFGELCGRTLVMR